MADKKIDTNTACYEISMAIESLAGICAVIQSNREHCNLSAGDLDSILEPIIERIGMRLERAHVALDEGIIGTFPMPVVNQFSGGRSAEADHA